MKNWQRITILFLCFGVGQVYCQNQTLLEIIGSDQSLEIKQSKIDSFLLINNESATNAELADMHHDLALHWYHSTWNSTGTDKYLLEAIAHTKEAVLLKSKLDPIDSISLKRSLFNLGFLQKLHGEFYTSINTHLRLVEIGGKDERVKAAYEELGDTYRTIGDYQKAVDHLEMALAVAQNDIQNYADKATAHIAMAQNYSSMGHREFADKVTLHLQKADSLIAQDTNANILIRAQIAMLRGNLLLMLGDHESAKQHLLKVLEYSNSHLSEFSYSDVKHNLATIHNSLGASYDGLGETKLALEHLNKALVLHNEFSSSYENLGDLYLNSGEVEKGLLHYQNAIALVTDKKLEVKFDDIPVNEDLELSPEKTLLLSHLVAKANGWLHYYEDNGDPGHLDQALKTFEAADQLIDFIRSESTEHQSKLYWRGQSANLYMKAVKACYLLDQPERAYYFMERNKALLLLEDLTHEEAKDISQLPPEMAEREFILKREIFLSENHLFEADANGQGVDSLKTLVRDSKYVYQEFIDSLNTAFPDYAKFKKKAAILSYEELMSGYVSNKQVVLHYILNEEDGYGLLTSSDGPFLFQLEETDKLNEAIETLTSMLSSGVSKFNIYNALSNALYKKLIPETVYNKIKGKQLTIIPDYILQRIPFETLVVDFESQKYLIEEVEVAYGYSMSLINQHQSTARNISTKLLGLAPISFSTLGLNPLDNSESEISGIADIFESKIFLNGTASKANFLKNTGEQKIIHLATHADIGDGENPWIAFSDDKMYLKEIYATKNQSDMVVLSACNTLSGNLKRGEGIMSLARGFFYGGAKSVVSSLWPVTDDTGNEIMVSFYENLKKGFSKSKALREAKLSYLNTEKVEELRHPFYWAGFVVVGDNSPLVNSKESIWIYLGMGLVLVVFFLLRKKLLQGIQNIFCFLCLKFTVS